MIKLIRAGLVCLVFCFAAIANAQTNFVTPMQTIKGAEKPLPNNGDLVELTVTPVPDASKPQYLVGTSYQFRVYQYDEATKNLLQKRFRQQDNILFFGAGTKSTKYFVECYVTYLYAVKTDKDVITEVGTRNSVISATVVIGDAPPPGPDPDPNPAPVIPKGRFGLGQKTYDLLVAKVGVETRSGLAKAFAEGFGSVAAKVTDGSLRGAEKIMEATSKANNDALTKAGIPRQAGVALMTEIENAVFSLYENRQINNDADFKDAWNEIVVGFSSAVK